MTKIVRNRINNNSDPEAVLNAGWQAMQAADPRLAQAIQRMPRDVAQNAVLQYTNAIRMGKEADASTMAADAVRAQLPAMSAPAATAAPARGFVKAARAQARPYDVDAFNKAIAPPAERQQRVGGSGLFKRAAERAALQQQQQQQQQQQDAFKQVKGQYDAYEMSGYTPDEKKIASSYGLPLDPTKKKNLNVPTNWSIPEPVANVQPEPFN